MAVQKIKQETRSNLSPQMAMLHQRWQQMRQIELQQVMQSSQTTRIGHFNLIPEKEYSAA